MGHEWWLEGLRNWPGTQKHEETARHNDIITLDNLASIACRHSKFQLSNTTREELVFRLTPPRAYTQNTPILLGLEWLLGPSS